MNVKQLIDQVEGQYGMRGQIARVVHRSNLNFIQGMAFSKDIEAFLVWDVYITIYKEITLSSTGYTSAIAGDIGKTVVGDDSEATGILIAYSNTTRKWIVKPVSGTFLDAEDLTITTGTGAGISEDAENYKGPYTVPSGSVPCRKILGVSSVSDLTLFNDPNFVNRNLWTPGRISYLGDNSFTFIDTPLEGNDVYRIVYYREAPVITTETDDANFLIPSTFRYSLCYGALVELGKNLMDGVQYVTPEQVLAPYLQDFWTKMTDTNKNMGERNTRSDPFI